MRKLGLSLVIMLIIGASHLEAQRTFRVVFETRNATCYNNGRILYTLLGENGQVLEAMPPGLTQVRIYYKLSEADTAHYSGRFYTGGTDSIILGHGTYIIGVSGLLDDGAGGYMQTDTHTVLTINSQYVNPMVEVVAGNPYLGEKACGTISSFPCMDIGRVQLQITGGRFPYHVTVLDHDSGDTLRTEVFNGHLHTGQNMREYDYVDYYSIDSLPGGNWDFTVEDGCGYGLPFVNQRVSVINFPLPSYTMLYAASGNFADSNVIHLSISYRNVTSPQEIFSTHTQYRFRNGSFGTTEWRQLPFKTNSDGRIHLFDTIHSIGRYCDIRDQKFFLDFKSETCGTVSQTFNFTILKPNESYFQRDTLDTKDSSKKIDNCSTTHYGHRDNYNIRYYDNNWPPYNPKYLHNVSLSTMGQQFYYTHPLTWIYTNMQNGTVFKKDTVEDIATRTYLRYEEVEDLYGSPGDSVIHAYVERKLVDAKGCELYTTRDTLLYFKYQKKECAVWEIASSESSNCISDTRWVSLSTTSKRHLNMDSLVVRLIRSPLNNRFNFLAVYNCHEKRWHIQKERYDNTANIVGIADGHKVIIQDSPLYSGPYEFEIITECDTFRVVKNVVFANFWETGFEEEPVFTIERDCGNAYVNYVAGRVKRLIYNTSPETGLPTDTATQYPLAQIDVISAPSPTYLNIKIFKNPPMGFNVSTPGEYVVKFHTVGNYSVCEDDFIRYDTLRFDEFNLKFVKAYALLCDTGSTEGDAYIEASNGTPPYIYTLYDAPDKQGNILATNGTGVFTNIPMHRSQTLSCLVTDSCNNYFHINLQPNTLTGLQRVWFDGNSKTVSACEGTTLRAHALNAGGIMDYVWTGPDGFTDTVAEPEFAVTRGSRSGWYKVVMRQSGCAVAISDSLFLDVTAVPQLTLSPDTTICPGEPIAVRFRTESSSVSGSVSFSVAYANASETETRTYTALSGETVTDTFATLTRAMIYPLSISDENCDYLFSNNEDTLHILLRDDITSSCPLLTRHDTVCHGSEAQLFATASTTPPYYLLWYKNHGMRDLLRIDTVLHDSIWARFDTADIRQRTALFVSLQQEGACPSVYGLATDTLALTEGATEFSCGQSYLLVNATDSSGANPTDTVTHRFSVSEGERILLTFNKLNLKPMHSLMIFSGSEAINDSLICILHSKSRTPEFITSAGRTLTILSAGRTSPGPTWEAIIESAPGIAIAEVWQKNRRTLNDRVCQSRTNTYNDTYGVVPEIVSSQEVNQALRNAGNYWYSRAFNGTDRHGCDSIVNFNLTVEAPERHVTAVTAANLNSEGYLWHDSLYTSSGLYAHLTSLPDGCDFIEVLDLTLVNAVCPSHDICIGDSVTLTIDVSVTEKSNTDSLLIPKVQIGHVLCTDGSTLSAEKFLTSGKTAKGVVFHVDSTGTHGLAAALTCKSFVSRDPLYTTYMKIHGLASNALCDIDGEYNTFTHKASAELAFGNYTDDYMFSYCYYFNHITLDTGEDPYGWYLPSLGEIGILLHNMKAVNNTLRQLKTMDDRINTFRTEFCSSTLMSNNLYITNFNRLSLSSSPISTYLLPIVKF